MAKAAETAKMAAPPTTVSRKRQRKTTAAGLEDDDDISDTSSVSSTKTSASARSRRSIDPSTPIRQSKRLLVRYFFSNITFNYLVFLYHRKERNQLIIKALSAKIQIEVCYYQLMYQLMWKFNLNNF